MKHDGEARGAAAPTAGRRLGEDELFAELARVRSTITGPALIACDGDGTLWRGDIGEALFEALLAADGVRDAAGPALAAEAAAHGVACEPGASPNELAATLGAAYRAGRYADGAAFAMMAWAFAGWHEDELAALAERVLLAFAFNGAVRAWVPRLRAWARANATEFWLVSASPRSIVLAAAARLDIDPTHVLAMTPRVDEGVVGAALAAPPSYARGKIERLRTARPEGTLVAAFGDSAYDFDLLAAARLPVAVAPSAALRGRMAELGSLTELVEGAAPPTSR